MIYPAELVTRPFRIRGLFRLTGPSRVEPIAFAASAYTNRLGLPKLVTRFGSGGSFLPRFPRFRIRHPKSTPRVHLAVSTSVLARLDSERPGLRAGPARTDSVKRWTQFASDRTSRMGADFYSSREEHTGTTGRRAKAGRSEIVFRCRIELIWRADARQGQGHKLGYSESTLNFSGDLERIVCVGDSLGVDIDANEVVVFNEQYKL